MCAGARVDIGKKIFVYRAAMMIKTQVHASSVSADVAAGIVVHGDVVNELGAKIKISEDIVFAFKAKAVMSRTAKLLVGRASRLIDHLLNRTEITVGENAAVRVGDAQIARPAIRNTSESHGVESQFGEVTRVG